MRFISRLTAIFVCIAMLMACIPTTVSALEKNGFVYEINEDGESVTITAYNGADTTITIPSSIDGLPVTVIGERAFEANTTITSVKIPSSVKTVQSMAFYGCTALATIDLSASTFDIGYQTFHNTAWHNNAPEGSLYVGRVFYGYIGAIGADTVIDIKQGTAAIAPYALSQRKNLHAVNIPTSLRLIGSCAFYNCTSLMEVTAPMSIRTIGTSAFYNANTAVIHLAKGSIIHQYAEGNKLFYVHDESLNYPDGDMNMDHATNSSDYRILMKMLLNPDMTYDIDRYWSSDVVCDGVVDSADIRQLMREAMSL